MTLRRYLARRLFFASIIFLLLPQTALAAVVYGSATCNGKSIDGFAVYDSKGRKITDVTVKNGTYRVKLPRGVLKAKYSDKPEISIRSSSRARQENLEFCR